ncbi:MAG: 50S ribosomal protein L21 [Pseudomonadota bacterium]
MFAVIKTGGKQYRVASGDKVTVERLDAAPGEHIQFNDVLMLGDGEGVTVGAPLIDGAAVQAEVLDQARGPKVVSFKKRRRKHGSQRKRGHRQHFTQLRVTEILKAGAAETGVKAAIGTGQSGHAWNPAPDLSPDLSKTEPAQDAPGIRPANLLDAADGEPDDLTRISGVGLGLRDKLNALGVFHFRQIAAWGGEEIAWMDAKLSFKGRIERDDWIGQATAMAAETA